MARKSAPFDWKYLLRPEDGENEPSGRLAGICKTAIWLGVSVLLGVGMGHLC